MRAFPCVYCVPACRPVFLQVAYNLCHELGIWEKQSSFYTQFKSTLNHIHDNIVYNGPRGECYAVWTLQRKYRCRRDHRTSTIITST